MCNMQRGGATLEGRGNCRVEGRLYREGLDMYRGRGDSRGKG